MQDIAQRTNIVRGECVHALQVAAAADQELERPHCPEGNNRYVGFVLADHAHLLLFFERNVVAQKTLLP